MPDGPPWTPRPTPEYQPSDENRRLVQVLRANGIAEAAIARNLRIDRKTLRKHFVEELRHGKEQVIAAVGATLVQLALRGNVNAARFWLACHGGPEWKVNREAWDPDGLAPGAERNTGVTINIRGGLPALPTTINGEARDVTDDEPETRRTNGAGTNGKDH